jgi:hypothetical protein
MNVFDPSLLISALKQYAGAVEKSTNAVIDMLGNVEAKWVACVNHICNPKVYQIGETLLGDILLGGYLHIIWQIGFLSLDVFAFFVAKLAKPLSRRRVHMTLGIFYTAGLIIGFVWGFCRSHCYSREPHLKLPTGS